MKNETPVRAKILSGVGGLYTAVTAEGELITCKPRGNFRHYEISPYPGDDVTLRLSEQGNALISEILPRKNFIKRPPVANVDKLFVTVAAADPAPSYITVDKLICAAEFYGITPVIIVTKADLDPVKADEIRRVYSACGFSVFVTSSSVMEGVEELKRFVYEQARGVTSAFAGESGVGKSSLMNAMFSDLALKTGETSRIHRGKHTTRAVSLFPLSDKPELGGSYIADTPGFGVLEPSLIPEFTKELLAECFREFVPHLTRCRYTKCTHLREEGCEIISALSEAENISSPADNAPNVDNAQIPDTPPSVIPKSRHDSYVTLYTELKNRKYK